MIGNEKETRNFRPQVLFQTNHDETHSWSVTYSHYCWLGAYLFNIWSWGSFFRLFVRRCRHSPDHLNLFHFCFHRMDRQAIPLDYFPWKYDNNAVSNPAPNNPMMINPIGIPANTCV